MRSSDQLTPASVHVSGFYLERRVRVQGLYAHVVVYVEENLHQPDVRHSERTPHQVACSILFQQLPNNFDK